MAKRANPRKESSTKSTATKPEPSKRVSILRDARVRRFVGLLLIFLALYLGISFISYLFTWKSDQDKVYNGVSFLFQQSQEVLNSGGRLGAWLSHEILYDGFGISAFLLLPVVLIWGLNRLFLRRFYGNLRSFFYATLIIVLLSPLLSWALPSSVYSFPYGGAFGEKIIPWLEGISGKTGTTLFMLADGLGLLMLLIIPLSRLSIWPQLYATNNNTEKAEPLPTVLAEPIELPIPTDVPFVVDTPVAAEVPDSFWEEQTPVAEPIAVVDPIQTEETENKPTPIELEPEVHEPVVSAIAQGPNDELPLEVVQPDEVKPKPKAAPVSIGTDEPYDPSLELRNYKFPTLDLLDQHSTDEISIDKNELEQNKNQIINTLKSFGISIAKISATVGPTVTLYEIVPSEGVRISKIRNLEDDIALSLSALGIRIIAPIPGKGTIGIEVPNLRKQIVSMRTLISSDKFINNPYSLPIALGKKIDNENYIVDLATMPHLLMAGATGQGKSVGINAILVSLLYKKHPSQVKFVMVDPKKVELSIYRLIEKHFLAKLPNEEEAIITDTKKVINTLNALCIEMDNRYDLLKEAGVRNIKEYNEKFIQRRLNPNKGHQYLPFIVLVVDEFADLIMTAGKEVEMPIARLAQLARAVGIHLIIATQRPSVNVITGTIKANFPGRIAFRVSAKVDSRTILDSGGAEQLIGRGDMLILNGSDIVRVQCAFVDTPEVERIVEFIGSQQGYPSAFDLPEYEGSDAMDVSAGGSRSLKEVDQMFEQCARLVVSSGSGSTSMLQRRFNLGYNRAGRIMDQLEAAGIVGAGSGGKARELMVHTEAELDEILRAISNR